MGILGQRAGFENISDIVVAEPNDIEMTVAREVLTEIRDNIERKGKAVIGFATGNTYWGIYSAMVHLLRNNEFDDLDLSELVTFNLDEYAGIPRDAEQSYHTFMWRNLFSEFKKHRFKEENAHIPDGELDLEGRVIRNTEDYRALVNDKRIKLKLEKRARDYDEAIKKEGGIDLQLCGVGTYDGHLGFNPKGGKFKSRTRLVELSDDVRIQNSIDFGGYHQMPSHCITMGLGNIMEARKVIVASTGERKAPINKIIIEGGKTEEYPATVLHDHENCTFYLDPSSAAHLTRYAKPWKVGDVGWMEDGSFNTRLVDKAVITLALENDEEILNLTRQNYRSAGLSSLVKAYREHGGVDGLNREVFDRLMTKVKKGMELPNGKNIVYEEPHPDDCIISGGGTLAKLARNNDVGVLTMTNGYISVPDKYVCFYLSPEDHREEHMEELGYTREDAAHIKATSDAINSVLKYIASEEGKTYAEKRNEILRQLSERNILEEDSEEVKLIKGEIRRYETKRVSEDVGAKSDFLDLPFYRKSWIHKNPPEEEDRRNVRRYIDDENPAIVFYAADLTDPHGTHRLCANLIEEEVKDRNIELWGYRGAWAEFDLWDVDVLVPLTKQQTELKRRRINYHFTQHHKAMYPGEDRREFYERVSERNYNTLNNLETLGVLKEMNINKIEYWGAEAFVVRKAA